LRNSYSKRFWASSAAGGTATGSEVHLRVPCVQQQKQQQQEQPQQEQQQPRLELQQEQQQIQQQKQKLEQLKQELGDKRLHLQQQQQTLEQQQQELEQLLPRQQKFQETNNEFHKAARYAAPIAHGSTYRAILKDATLPSWEAKVSQSRINYCSKGAWDDLASGSWYSTLDGELLYEPSSCKLRRLTADAARQCLANKTLSFVGDSLSRYQYLSLAYFLSHGHYMQRYGTDGGNRTLAHERTCGNFSTFYSEGSRSLQHQSAATTAMEACDCYRLGLDNTTREERTLSVDTLMPATPGQGVNRSSGLAVSRLKVGYRQAFGMKTNVLDETLDAIRRVAQDNSTAENIILVNLGHWFDKGMVGSTNTKHRTVAAVYEPLLANAKAAAGNGRAQFIWKSTTASFHGQSNALPVIYDWHSLLTSMARHYRWNVMDAFGVTRSMMTSGMYGFWDALHYHAFVYDQLNDVLLNGLC
jgi:flagellar motor protein MotB